MNEQNSEHAIGESELSKVSGGGYVGPCFLYTVVKGDNLNRIAKRYGTTVQILAELNKVDRNHPIRVGNQLLIPVTNND